MKNKKYLIIFLTLIALVLPSGCSKGRGIWLDNLTAAEKKEFEGGEIPEERIENLKEGISAYTKEVERTVKASKQIGIYYRMLVLEYMSLEMYGEAVKAAEEAVRYFPSNQLLYYYAAVSSAQMSMAVFDEEEKGRLIIAAEEHYLRALRLDPSYKEALYGLSVLYVFELNRPFDAEPLLERLVSLSSKNWDAMFLLARVKIIRGDVEAAMDLYMIIEEGAKDTEAREKAAENRRRLLGGFTGG